MSEAGGGCSVVSPPLKELAGMGETVEHFFIGAFILQFPIEALD